MKHQATFETNVSEMLIHSLYKTKKTHNYETSSCV